MPNSELGKLLLVFFQEIGAISPMAFQNIDLDKALLQADKIAEMIDLMP
jgi:hypothetical protein